MLVAYPALFYYDPDEVPANPYFVTFPDLKNSATQGESPAHAIFMASDYLGITLADALEQGRSLPQPSDINALSLKANNPFKDDEDMTLNYDPEKSFISLVSVDVANYLGSQEPIKKTLTIPRWADKIGCELGLNFSQTLTDAIANKKLGSNS